jgi:hypothetical protein
MSQEKEKEKVRDTIMQLSEITDLIGLRQHIIDGTSKGRKVKADVWHNTRDYMKRYADPANTDAAIALFESVGCKDEIQAVRWLLKHDELVP